MNYKLNGRETVPCGDSLEWARWLETADRQVAKTDLDGDAFVSTVFLGIDHGFGRTCAPVLFETMVFGGRLDQEQDRYHTWEEAERGHADMVARALAAPPLPADAKGGT